MNKVTMKLLLRLLFIAAPLALTAAFLGGSSAFTVEGAKAQRIIATVKALAAIPFIQEKTLEGETAGRINVLMLGASGPGYESPLLTDTILVASFAPAANSLALISIPRDLLVEMPNRAGFVTRVNTLYMLSKQDEERNGDTDFRTHVEATRQKVEEITDLTIPYAALMNVRAFEEIVNAVGGVNVYVDREIRDPRFPTLGFGYEVFTLAQGWRFLDGRNAERYVRTRNDIRGDFGRMERQQQVIEALIAKARALRLIADFPKLFSLFTALGGNIQTTFEAGELKRAWALVNKENAPRIKTLAIDGGRPDSLLVDYRPRLGARVAATLVPRAGTFDYSEIQDKIQGLLTTNY